MIVGLVNQEARLLHESTGQNTLHRKDPCVNFWLMKQ